jgi:predicted dehydrogenase
VTGMIRMGLLGATKIAGRAIIMPAEENNDVHVAAVAAHDNLRAMKFAEEHHIPQVYPTYADLLEDPRIDAVYISTHPAAHFALTLAAMRVGKHVLVEKPLCLGVCEAERLRLAQKRAEVCLQEAVMAAHHPWTAAVPELADSHGLGALRDVRTQLVFDRSGNLGYRAYPELGGGAFIDTAPYWLQMLQAYRGLDVVSVRASSAFDGPHGTDTELEAELGYRDGVTATLRCGLSGTYRADHTFSFDGGDIRVRNFMLPARGRLPLNVFVRPKGLRASTVGFDPIDYYERQLAEFVRLITAPGRGSHLLDEAVERATLAERISLSALRGRSAGYTEGIKRSDAV